MDLSFLTRRLEEEESDGLWVIGVVLVLFGTVGQNLGNNLASLAHHLNTASEHADNSGELEAINKGGDEKGSGAEKGGGVDDAIPKKSDADEGSFWKRHLWLVGTCTFCLGSVMNFVSFGYAAQSLLASLQSIQFVSNMIFAKVVHNEDVTWTMALATFAICCGNVLVVIFAEHDATKFTGQEIFALWRENTAWHVYIVVMGTTAICCEYTYRSYNHSRMVKRKLRWMHSFLEPACYCIASASIGTIAVMTAKCLSMYLTGGDAGGEFQDAPLYVGLITWIAAANFWLRRMDAGLNLFPPLFFIPVLMITFVFINILCGGIFFKEFAAFNDQQWAGFIVGAVCIIGGVFFLAPNNEIELGPEPNAEGAEQVMNNVTDYTRRLSFSTVQSDDESVRSNGGSPLRGRTSTMSHPLAALKEAHHRASQVESFAAFEKSLIGGVEEVEITATRTLRRVSNAIGITEEQQEEIEKDHQKVAGSEEAAANAVADLEAPVAES
jgi:hypothetical protein